MQNLGGKQSALWTFRKKGRGAVSFKDLAANFGSPWTILRHSTSSLIRFEIIALILIVVLFTTNRKKFGSGRIMAFPYMKGETTILQRGVST